MTTGDAAAGLESLLRYLDGLSARASVKELQNHLNALEIGVDDLSDFAQFDEDRYLRNLVREGPYYHVLVLCWRSGQRSPIHNHAASTCGLRVLSGVATETVFQRTPSSLVKAVSSVDQHAGSVSVSQDGYIHQVSNLQAAGQDLVTLHVYSPPLLRMATFSLTERSIGEFRPVVLQHAEGSGI